MKKLKEIANFWSEPYLSFLRNLTPQVGFLTIALVAYKAISIDHSFYSGLGFILACIVFTLAVIANSYQLLKQAKSKDNPIKNGYLLFFSFFILFQTALLYTIYTGVVAFINLTKAGNL